MSRQLEQALFSLMPAYGSDLPPSLVELASSLVSQSRFKAGNLKAEEEVARLYACANLACDRLKTSLDLPPIQPRPPIPPRIYKRLYNHLDRVIPSPTSTPTRTRSLRTRTPTSRAAAAADDRPMPSRVTPTAEQSLAQFRTGDAPSTTPTGARRSRRSAAVTATVRPWVRPVARFACAETGRPKLALTVVAGMEAITVPGGRETKDDWVRGNYAALFAAVLYWSVARARAALAGKEVTRGQPSLNQRREIISLLARARRAVTVPTPTPTSASAFAGQDDADDDDGDAGWWAGWADLKPRDFNAAVATVEQRGWLGDWWTAIDDVVEAKGWDGKDEGEHGEDADLAGPIRVRRADTMLQDKYDYLSAARKARYQSWRADLLARMTPVTVVDGNAMEVDSR